DDIDWQTSTLHVRRAKDGIGTRQPLAARELRALRRLQREASGVHLFVSERGAPLSVAGYQRMVARAGEAARFPFRIHSHMLQHSCGYKLANDGHDTRAIQHYLGHRSIASTVRYTTMSSHRLLNGSVPTCARSPPRAVCSCPGFHRLLKRLSRICLRRMGIRVEPAQILSRFDDEPVLVLLRELSRGADGFIDKPGPLRGGGEGECLGPIWLKSKQKSAAARFRSLAAGLRAGRSGDFLPPSPPAEPTTAPQGTQAVIARLH